MPICSRCGSEIEFRYIDGPVYRYISMAADAAGPHVRKSTMGAIRQVAPRRSRARRWSDRQADSQVNSKRQQDAAGWI
jgi:hypothetical protein